MSIQYILYIFFILSILSKGERCKSKSQKCKVQVYEYGTVRVHSIMCQAVLSSYNTLYFPATLRAKPAVCHQAPSPARERRT